mmetsp:Transcript_2377/g.5138  ORF Transcript_2377/g.5138 Transcript_2377/m.5138 type:complete len:318 (-) Transcript_2377:66-1019(-)
MATAGDRYEERTGNIWSYAHRGDMTGLKAAVIRGVDVNMINTVGWTPCHAAAAGGQTKALRYLVKKMGADLTITDKGGNLPVHHAAKNGHVHALRTLQELGADVTKVRLSQAKGKAARDLVVESYRKVGKNHRKDGTGSDDDDEDDVEPVGYARRQSKSTAFWGPRRTPISCAIKKKIIKDKRKIKKEKVKRESDLETVVVEPRGETLSNEEGQNEPSYLETVQQVKRSRKQKRQQRQQSRNNSEEQGDLDNKITETNYYNEFEVDQTRMDANIPEEAILYEGSSDEDGYDDDEKSTLSSNGQFAALALILDDSDSE